MFFRRMTNFRFQMPIYMDQQELDAAYTSSDITILLDTSKARFFTGQRIGISQLDACNQITSSTFHTILSLTATSITLSSALGVNVAQGSYVFPIMDCEVALEVLRIASTSCLVCASAGGSHCT